MNVIVDTSVWSLAVRRAKRVDNETTGALASLIREGRVLVMGAIRQELLSGIKSDADGDFRNFAGVLGLELHQPR